MIDTAIYELTKLKLEHYEELKYKNISCNKAINLFIKMLREIDKY